MSEQPIGQSQSVVKLSTILLAAGAIGLGYILLTQATGELVLLFGAIVTAEGMRPPVRLLTRRGWPKPLAILTIYAAALLFIGLLGYFVFTPLVAQVTELINNAPEITHRLEATVLHYQELFRTNPSFRTLVASAPERISSLITQRLALIVQAPIQLIGFLSNIVLLLLLAFFWLTATQSLEQFALRFISPGQRANAQAIFAEISRKLGGYVRGVLINMLVIGLLSGFGARLLGVPYTFLLGVVAGLTEAIPVVGPLIGGAVAIVVAWIAIGPAKAGQTALLYAAIQQIEGNTLVPIVMNRAVELHPLAIITALIIGSALLGVPGAILAVPAAAVVQVGITRIILPTIEARRKRLENVPQT